MGWASGSELLAEVVRAAVPLHQGRDDAALHTFYVALIRRLELFDCDTLDETRGQLGDEWDRALDATGWGPD